jgi:hypothetical protein
MSLFRIDGYTLPVNEIFTWIAGFVTIHRKGMLSEAHLPGELDEIMDRQGDDKKAIQEILVYLNDNPDYMDKFIKIVKNGMTVLATEKHMNQPTDSD